MVEAFKSDGSNGNTNSHVKSGNANSNVSHTTNSKLKTATGITAMLLTILSLLGGLVFWTCQKLK